MESINKRVEGIDFFRAIMSFLVVTIHVPIEGQIGVVINLVSRCAVPYFFMVSGFFFNKELVNLRVRKILRLIVLSSIFYALYDIAVQIITSSFTLDLQIFSTRMIVKYIFFGENPFAIHLWYLSALLYVTLIFSYIEKKQYISFLMYLLLCIGLCVGQYSNLLIGKEFESYISRNWIFIGLPFYYLGYYLKHLDTLILKISKKLIVVSIISFIILLTVERIALVEFNIFNNSALYIFNIPLTISFFLLALNIKDLKVIKKIAEFGRKYASDVYIYHVSMIRLSYYVSYRLSSFIDPDYSTTIICYFFTIVFCSLIKAANNRYIKFCQ